MAIAAIVVAANLACGLTFPLDGYGPDGTDAASDAPADSPHAAPEIACSGSSCTVGTEVCCGKKAAVGTCTPPAACDAGIPIPCDDTTDCAASGEGSVCCATFEAGVLLSVACVPGASCRGGGAAHPLCALEAGACPGATGPCLPSGALPDGIGKCQN